MHAKGKREPVPAWLVIGAEHESRVSRTPLVGRDHELLLLLTVWNRAVEVAEPHLVSMIGHAGIGKSRLAAELGARVEPMGARVLWGRSVSYDQQTPYRAAAQMVRSTAGIFESDPAEAAREKLTSLVAALAPADEAASMTRYLSLLLGLGLDPAAQEPLDIRYATRRLFEQLSERAPVLAIFDDIHWADDALLDLLDYLGTQLRGHRVVIVALARPEFFDSRPTWGAGRLAHTSLLLNPLSPNDANRAVWALLARPSEATVDKIVATADGNPLFLEELVASIQDEPGAGELPATIRAVIASRIDALPAPARSALLRAAVIGKAFWRGVLARVGGVDEIGAALDALEARGLIQRRSRSRIEGDVEFAFKHDLILEAAYATLPRALRRELHAATAAALEVIGQDTPDIARILAHHWSEAGEAARASRYLVTAAERARDALAAEEMYDLYTQAHDLATDDAARTQIKLLRALALAQLEDFGRADRELAELIPLLDGAQKVEALVTRADCTLWTEQTDATMEGASLAVRLAREGGFADLEAYAISVLGGAYGMRGEEGDLQEAIRLGEQGARLWEPDTRSRARAVQYHLMGDHYYWAGEYDKALNAAKLATVAAGLEIHSAEFLLRGGGMQGMILAGMGRYEEAITATDRSIELAVTMGRPRSVVTNYSTLPLREIFAIDEALTRSEEVAEQLGPSDFNMPWMNARADVFSARVLRGDYAQAMREWDALWADALASKAWERWLVSGRVASVRADLELALGHVDEAIAWATRAVDMATASTRRKYRAIARTTRGRALTVAGRNDLATRELRDAVDEADSLGSPLLRWQARFALAHASEGSGLDAQAPYEEAAAIVRTVVAGLTPSHAAGYLAAAPVVAVLDAVR